MANQTPEQIARDNIDRMLQQAGWLVQDEKEMDIHGHSGVAVREFQVGTGFADYLLFVNGTPCGIIEAKKESEGHKLTTHEEQAEQYAAGKLKYMRNNEPRPFIYQSTGTLTRFTNMQDPKPRSTAIFHFHSPATLAQMLKETHSLRARLRQLPRLPGDGLRQCQFKAINHLEQSFRENKPRALIQMATGSGKTYTAVTSIYRLLKFADAKRVLFLVDTKNLGQQAEQEFMAYSPSDDNRKFTELYNVQRLTSSFAAPTSQVCISTIQRMYSILRSEELDESVELQNPNERVMEEKPKEIAYNPDIPPEFFDFIVIDECHRSIYNTWKQVLEYFNAFLIGLTATPDKRTFGFFNENIVSEYTHTQAVADGVNVGFDIYTIETETTKQGGKLKAKEYVDRRHRLTRKTRWTQLDDDINYTPNQLDRDVVVVSQIRNITKAFKEALPTMFPARTEVPKTLIFAKTDSHADDIINMVREEFNEENRFCKKVTYNSKENPQAILAAFRNEYYPRIAVTVDMIATGTDVRPLECLLFMRDVRSRGYFEQMKGRGTRTQGLDDLKRVTPSALSEKTHFVIVDAVGVTKSIKTDSKPMERKRSVPIKELLYQTMMGSDDEDVLNSLAGRLARLDRKMTEAERQEFETLAKGKPIKAVIHDLLAVNDPDRIEDLARVQFNLSPLMEPNEAQKQEAQQKLVRVAASSFNGKLNTFVENVQRNYEQVIDNVNIDHVTHSGWSREADQQAADTVTDFTRFIEENRDEITALKIFYNQPFNGRQLSYDMVASLLETLKQQKPRLAPMHVWQAYEKVEKVNGTSPKSQLVALVSLVRRVIGIDDVLTPFDSTVNRNFKEWAWNAQQGNAPKFNEEQMKWLRMVRDHIAASFHLERDDLDLTPFNKDGGLGKMYQLFGSKMDSLIDELNEALSA